MKTLMIRCCWRCVVLAGALLGMLLPDAALAGKFRYPGEELLGTWRIARYDMSEFAQPMSQDTMDGLVHDFPYFLPPGQIIQITLDGIYAQPPTQKVVPWLVLRTVSPISDSICRFSWWQDLCKKSGKVPTGYFLEDYVGVTVDSYGKSVDAVVVNSDGKKRSVPWPDASKYEFFLSGMPNGLEGFNVRTLKGNKLLVMYYGGSDSWANDFRGNEQWKELRKATNEKKIGTLYSVWERVTPPPATRK